MRTKTRLTITLADDLVDKIDDLIAGSAIKNRSHAIETLISQALSPTIRTAVILAGGKEADKNNAGLKKLGDTYVLALLLGRLKQHHITRVIICTDSTNTTLMKRLGNGENLGMKIEYSLEDKPLGTGGAVKKARGLIKNQPFLVIHGDVLTALNFSELGTFHFKEGALATIAVKPRLGEANYGQVFMQGNKILKFLASSADAGISIINTGVYAFDPKLFDILPEQSVFTLEKDVFPLLARRNQLSAFVFQGGWYDISTEASYQEAQDQWKELTA